MNVLITGGAGYIGTELTTILLKDENIRKVVVYDNLSRDNHNFFIGRPYENGHKLKFVFGDLLDSRSLNKILSDIDVVYHLAAKVTTPFANVDSHYFEQVNHWGTAELIYAIEKSNVKKFVYTSSISIYGASKKFVNEDSEPNPRTFYGISKLRGEEHVKRLLNKIDTYILRCGNVYGYNKSMRFDSVVNRFMFEANFNNKISIHGKGRQNRAFIHVNYLANILKQVIFEPVPSGVYNVVDKNMQVLDIVETLKDIYPGMEYIFINQHLDLRELKVDPESPLFNYIQAESLTTFKEEMKEFKNQLAF